MRVLNCKVLAAAACLVTVAVAIPTGSGGGWSGGGGHGGGGWGGGGGGGGGHGGGGWGGGGGHGGGGGYGPAVYPAVPSWPGGVWGAGGHGGGGGGGGGWGGHGGSGGGGGHGGGGGGGGHGGGGYGGGGYGGDGGYAYPRYNFAYGVSSGKTGDIKSASESRDGDSVSGSYTLHGADGHTRTVNYSASKHTGFVAQVLRDGVPDVPPAPAKLIQPTSYHTSLGYGHGFSTVNHGSGGGGGHY